jgi:phage repressor protein C with HTH and peptisase S24 domain
MKSGSQHLSTLGYRIQRAITGAGLSFTAAGERLGVSKGTVSNWVNNKHAPSFETLREIADLTRSDYNWLLTGRGIAPKAVSLTKANDAALTPQHNTAESSAAEHSYRSIKKVMSVHSEGRSNVPHGFIPQIAAMLGMGNAADADTIQIPLGGGSVMSTPVVEVWKIPESVLRRRLFGSIDNIHIVECVGDSMEPTIRNGDFVFIDTGSQIPHPPGIFAISETLGPTLKRVEVVEQSDPVRVRVIPENQRHSSYELLLDEITIIGRYLCRLTME